MVVRALHGFLEGKVSLKIFFTPLANHRSVETRGGNRPGPGAGQEGQLPRAPTCLGPIYNNIILILY